MKQIFKPITIAIVLLTIVSCNQNSPAPSNTGNTNNNNNTNLTPLETSLVGSWKLKRTEYRSSTFVYGLGDSTWYYTNHYNYYNSIIEFKATPSNILQDYYSCVIGISDMIAPGIVSWKEGPNNSITIDGQQSYFRIKYLSPDSMVLDGHYGTRYFFNKNTMIPKLNPIELQLSGNPWQLISENGQVPLYPTYKHFKSTWYTDNGYLSTDSFVNFAVSPASWEVLYPNRTIPILYNKQDYFKIISLTPNNLRLEGFYPQMNSTSTSTLIYSR